MTRFVYRATLVAADGPDAGVITRTEDVAVFARNQNSAIQKAAARAAKAALRSEVVHSIEFWSAS